MTPHQMGSTAFHLVLLSTIARVHATSVDKQMHSKRKHFQEYNVLIFNFESCSNLGSHSQAKEETRFCSFSRYGEKSYRMELGGKVKGLLETGTIVSFGASEEFLHVSRRTEQSFFLQSESTCCSYTTTISLYDVGRYKQ